MAKQITIDDCRELRKKFENYCNTAQQHQFPLLLMIDLKMQATLEKVEEAGVVENQKDMRAMFRVVLKTIGESDEEYQEEEARHDR